MRVAPSLLAALLTALAVSACVTITPINRDTAEPTPTAPGPIAVAPTPRPHATGSSASSTKPPTLAPRATPTPTRAPATVDPNDPACTDDAYALEGFKWNTTFRWRFSRESVPANLDADAALAIVQTAFDNVLTERNDCGRPDAISAKALYQGESTTNHEPCEEKPDGQNTVSFGKVPTDISPDAIAYTCPFSGFLGGSGTGTKLASDADIVISDDVPWWLGGICLFSVSLEATVTHEVGHVFGLDHDTEDEHPDLTMSEEIGDCDNSPTTLGLGDMLGLEALYPSNP